MHTIVFDTLQCSKRLQEAGFSQQQAEAQAEEIAKVINEQLATKQDLEHLSEQFSTKLDRLSTKLGSVVVTCTGFLALIHFFK